MSDIFDKENKVTWLHHKQSETTPPPKNAKVVHIFQDMIDDMYVKADEEEVSTDNILQFYTLENCHLHELSALRELAWHKKAAEDSWKTALNEFNRKFGRENIKHNSRFLKMTISEA